MTPKELTTKELGKIAVKSLHQISKETNTPAEKEIVIAFIKKFNTIADLENYLKDHNLIKGKMKSYLT